MIVQQVVVEMLLSWMRLYEMQRSGMEGEEMRWGLGHMMIFPRMHAVGCYDQ